MLERLIKELEEKHEMEVTTFYPLALETPTIWSLLLELVLHLNENYGNGVKVWQFQKIANSIRFIIGIFKQIQELLK